MLLIMALATNAKTRFFHVDFTMSSPHVHGGVFVDMGGVG